MRLVSGKLHLIKKSCSIIKRPHFSRKFLIFGQIAFNTCIDAIVVFSAPVEENENSMMCGNNMKMLT